MRQTVPQEVPVANPIAAPIMNITAGRNSLRLPALAMAALTNSAEYMAKRVKEQSVQAKGHTKKWGAGGCVPFIVLWCLPLGER